MSARLVGHPRLRERYGPWAVVTGASDGIGREFAERLADAGFHLVLVARRELVLVELAKTLHARTGLEVVTHAADLGVAGACQQLARMTATRDVGLLIAAAGFGSSGDFLARPLDDELAQIAVNCSATVELAHLYGERFVARGRGGMVLMSSLLAFQGVPRAATYAATKAFVQTFAEGLRLELAPHHVDVIACAPGPINSGFANRAHMTMGLAQGPDAVALATLRALGRQPTVRPGWLSKFLEFSLSWLPRRGRVRVMARVMRGMT